MRITIVAPIQICDLRVTYFSWAYLKMAHYHYDNTPIIFEPLVKSAYYKLATVIILKEASPIGILMVGVLPFSSKGMSSPYIE